jgi:hypothetical protein
MNEEKISNQGVGRLKEHELQKYLLNFTFAVQCYELATLQDQNRLAKIKEEIQSSL